VSTGVHFDRSQAYDGGSIPLTRSNDINKLDIQQRACRSWDSKSQFRTKRVFGSKFHRLPFRDSYPAPETIEGSGPCCSIRARGVSQPTLIRLALPPAAVVLVLMVRSDTSHSSG